VTDFFLPIHHFWLCKVRLIPYSRAATPSYEGRVMVTVAQW
jgi:hypothetical protein